MRALGSLVSLSLVAVAACSDPTTTTTTPAASDQHPQLAGRPRPDIPVAVTVLDPGNRIQSDGGGEYVNGQNGVAAYIDPVGNLQFNTGGTPRTLRFDYSVQVSGDLFTPEAPADKVNFNTQAGVDLATLGVGQSICSSASFGYTNPTTYTVIGFHTYKVPIGSSVYVYLTRTSSTTWTLTAGTSLQCDGSDYVGGVSYNPNTTLRPKQQITLLGYFSLPFSFVVRLL